MNEALITDFENGTSVFTISKKHKLPEKTVEELRDNWEKDNLPIEHVIRLIERGDSKKDIVEQWGSDLYEEAMSFLV